jgi:methionine aminopeptidase
MTKQEEVKRFKDLSSEPDSYLSLLLNGFEDKFQEYVRNDEVYSIQDMLELRDKEISKLEEELKRVRLVNTEIKKNIKKYLELIGNAGYNLVAIKGFVTEINKLLEEL